MYELYIKLNSLVIFRDLLNNKLIKTLQELIYMSPKEDEYIKKYCEFVSLLYSKSTDNLSDYILKKVLENENIYIKLSCKGKVHTNIQSSLNRELLILQELSQLELYLQQDFNTSIDLPKYEINYHDFTKIYTDHIINLPIHGYGVYAKYHVFTVKDKKIMPVKHPDTQQIDNMFSYENERQKVFENTVALLEGKTSANVLLYGDAGTGKSSTIKAVANELFNRGLRLIEVKKHQLFQIPDILDSLSDNPLKFILFIDDLSFTSDDDNFAALKAILEGSVSAKGKNLAVYATSNRRHLVKETFSARNGDDVHVSETLQELMSLSARFGLSINYSKPDRDAYILIVNRFAQLYELGIPQDELIKKAEAFAIRGHGRSPRSAKQFIEQLKAKE